jgi:LPXTG-motif cell wall-anchored protein
VKTSRLVLAPAVAVALTGLAGAPALAETSSPATVPPTEVCAQEGGQQSSNDPEADSSVPDESDPQATLAHAQVSRADIANNKKGIGFSGTGFTPDQKATVTVIGTDGTEYSPEKKLTVDEKGEVSGTYFFTVTEGAKVPVGEYSLYLTDLKSEQNSSKVSFEVVPQADDVDDSGNSDSGDSNEDCKRATAPADDGDKGKEEDKAASEDPSESETPEPTESDDKSDDDKSDEKSEDKSDDKKSEDKSDDDKSEDKSDDGRAEHVNPGPAKEPTTEAPTPTETKTETPEPTETDEPTTETPDPTKTGEPSTQAPDPTETDGSNESANGSDESGEPEDKKSEDSSESKESDAPETTGPASPGTDEKKAPAAAKQSLYIDPTEISSEDFLNKGIKLGVSGAQPGEKVTITVEHAQGKVDRYTMTKQADSEGKVTFGVQAKVKAVLGTYKVTAQAESFDEPQGGTFTVLTNGTAVDDGNSSNAAGNDLPRTGAEMTGLALGVGLLAVGAAAVIITRRRMNASDDPAEF